MSTDGVDHSRRRFLTVAASVVGGAGAVMAAVPFVSSMNPSARAQAAGAPVEVDVNKLEPGQLLTVAWRGKPVWVLRRTEKQVKDLPTLNGLACAIPNPKSRSSLRTARTFNARSSRNTSSR